MNPLANGGYRRDRGSVPGQEDPLEEGMNPFQYSCPENPMTEQPGGQQA